MFPCRGLFVFDYFTALRALYFAVRRRWDACAACGKVGPVMGLRPLRGPPCIPPEAPPKWGFQLPWRGEGTRLTLRELPSLATLTQVISLRDALMPESAFASTNNTLQPNTINAETASGNGFVPFSIASGHFGITNLKKIKLQHEHDRQLHSACGDANCLSTMTRRINYESEKSVPHQEIVVESPSLYSPKQRGGDGWC